MGYSIVGCCSHGAHRLVASSRSGYLDGRGEEVTMPNEMPAITLALVIQMWFLAVLIAVGAMVWRQAHPKERRSRR